MLAGLRIQHAKLCFAMQMKYYALSDDMQEYESLLRLIEATDFKVLF